MRRSISIFLWILVGAFAAGGSVGYFLHTANQDRQFLVTQTRHAELSAEQAKTASTRLAQDANHKLQEASSEIQRVKEELSTYREHQRNLARAVSLPKPVGRMLRGWNPTLSLRLGLSFLVPPGTYATETHDRLTALSRGVAGDQTWMTIVPYDKLSELSWLQSVTNTVPVLYTFDHQHTLIGFRGTQTDTSDIIYVLHLSNFSTSTHLLWLAPNTVSDEERALQTLSTLSVNP